MKASVLLSYSVALVSGAFAAALPADNAVAMPQLEARLFGSEIVSSVNKVKASVDALDKKVTAVNAADINQFLPILDASNALASTLSTQQAYVAKQQPLDLVGALNVQLAVTPLISSVQKLAKDLIAIKKYAVQLGVDGVVKDTVTSQRAASASFAATLSSKVPALAKPIADSDAKQIDDALASVIKAYSS